MATPNLGPDPLDSDGFDPALYDSLIEHAKTQEREWRVQARAAPPPDNPLNRRKPPGWLDAFERNMGGRVTAVEFDDGRRIEAGRLLAQRRATYNWDLGAQLLVQGRDAWAIAYELGCPVEGVRRRLADPNSKLNRMVEAARAERRRLRELRLEQQGDGVLASLVETHNHGRGDADKWMIRWLVNRVAGNRPAGTAKPGEAPLQALARALAAELRRAPPAETLAVPKRKQARLAESRPDLSNLSETR